MEAFAIETNNITKQYALYDSSADRLREALSLRKKKYHRDFFALSGVTFNVRRGETVGIIGTNGSGKSTLLKILTGVIAPTGGSFAVNGKISALLELGAGFNMEYTGRENVYLNGTIMGYTEEEITEKLDAVLQFADIGDFIDQPVKNYSSGMFARLAFSVAINVEPDILIVDEALSVGDIAFQNKCFRKFRELCEKGVTILFVSHGLDIVRQMCDRVLWIEKGEQRMFGESEAVCNAFFDEQMKKQRTYYGCESLDEESYRTEETVISCPRIPAGADGIVSDEVEILSAFFTDRNAKITERLECGRSYTFHTIIRAHEDLRDLIVGMNLITRHGLVTFGDNTLRSLGCDLAAKKGETLEICIAFDLPYIRGEEYLVEAAVSQGTQDDFRALTWLHNVVKLDVVRPGLNLAVCQTRASETTVCRRGQVELY